MATSRSSSMNVSSHLLLLFLIIISVCLVVAGQEEPETPTQKARREKLSRMPCFFDLMDCRPFLFEDESKDKVSKACCNQLKAAAATKQQCLCAVYKDSEMLRLLAVKTYDLQTSFPKQCGLEVLDDSKCKKYPPPKPDLNDERVKRLTGVSEEEELKQNGEISSSGVSVFSLNNMLSCMMVVAAMQFTLLLSC